MSFSWGLISIVLIFQINDNYWCMNSQTELFAICGSFIGHLWLFKPYNLYWHQAWDFLLITKFRATPVSIGMVIGMCYQWLIIIHVWMTYLLPVFTKYYWSLNLLTGFNCKSEANNCRKYETQHLPWRWFLSFTETEFWK